MLENPSHARTNERALSCGILAFFRTGFIARIRTESGRAFPSEWPRSFNRHRPARKASRSDQSELDFTAQRILHSIDESLRRLQVEVIDIATCHDIEFVSIAQVISEAIPALHRAREQGKIRFIGVSSLPL